MAMLIMDKNAATPKAIPMVELDEDSVPVAASLPFTWKPPQGQSRSEPSESLDVSSQILINWFNIGIFAFGAVIFEPAIIIRIASGRRF